MRKPVQSADPLTDVPEWPEEKSSAPTIYTTYPYSVPCGRPRYAALSTLDLQVEDTSCGHTGAGTIRAIARYVDTCRTHGVPAFTTDIPSSGALDGIGADRRSDGSVA